MFRIFNSVVVGEIVCFEQVRVQQVSNDIDCYGC